MKKGKIKFFNSAKGFGFIVDDETGREVFVHSSGLKNNVQEGDRVSFDIADGHKGPNAINVTRI